MPNLDNTQVQNEEGLVSTTPETQTDATQVANNATPAAPVQQDAESLAQIKAQLQKYEQDIRALKSSADKRLHEASVQSQQREAQLRAEVEELKLNTMDEEARGKYVQARERQRLTELETKASQASEVQKQYEASLGAIQHFTSLGVPLSELVMNQGYDALFQSGYKYITETYKKASKVTAPPPPPTAPAVANSNGSVPNLSPTWEDLVKTYGSVEAVYRGVESGRLPPSIIPIPKE